MLRTTRRPSDAMSESEHTASPAIVSMVGSGGNSSVHSQRQSVHFYKRKCPNDRNQNLR